MTARNRLRKRAAQKAKVPNFGIKKSKPDIIPQNASAKNPPDDRNNHTSKSSVLTSKPISTENNANKASTAARINPISNQVQTVVIFVRTWLLPMPFEWQIPSNHMEIGRADMVNL